MVKLEEHKIIIEIDTQCPVDDLENITESLLNCFSGLSMDLVSQDDIRNAFWFLKSLQPTYDQIKQMHGKQK